MEIEAKFYLSNPEALRQRLTSLDAERLHGPVLERNWRLDDDQGRLTQRGLVLRLRVDDAARLTFKAPSDVPEVRQEFEFEVSDAHAASALLEGLGFRPIWVYEKRRTIYSLDGAEVMLDELPFGAFVEIEAPSVAALEAVARRLGLEWSHRLPASYWALFTRLAQARPLGFRDATFENFAGQPPVRPEELGAQDGLTAPARPSTPDHKDSR